MDEPRQEERPGRRGAGALHGRCLPVGAGCGVAVAGVSVLGLVLRPFAWIRVTYGLATLVVPALLVAGAAVDLACGPGRAPSGRRGVYTALGLALALVGVRVWATHVEPYRLRVREASIATPKVRRTLRIAHLSDIQSARVGEWERRVVTRVRGLAPDLVLFTGDLLQTPTRESFVAELPVVAGLLSSLEPRLGLFGVYGNTDRYLRGVQPDQVGGLRILDGVEARVGEGDLRLRVLGLTLGESLSPSAARLAVARWLETVGEEDVTVVMGHAPDFALGVRDLPVDLCLAGHTHGGQIRLPLVGPLVTLSSVPRSWARGFRSVGLTHLDVSAGIGAERADGLPPIRLDCPPELTLITLVPVAPVADRERTPS